MAFTVPENAGGRNLYRGNPCVQIVSFEIVLFLLKNYKETTVSINYSFKISLNAFKQVKFPRS